MLFPAKLQASARLVEARLGEILANAQTAGTPERLAAAMKHAVLGGGKRFRPFLVLESAGLISRGKEAQWRPSRIKAGPLKEAVDYIQQYREFWEASFDRLDDYLVELQSKDQK